MVKAQVMTAADQVAEGDFSVRAPEGSSGEFGRLASSFNSMVEELELADQQRHNLTVALVDSPEYEIHLHQISPTFS